MSSMPNAGGISNFEEQHQSLNKEIAMGNEPACGNDNLNPNASNLDVEIDDKCDEESQFHRKKRSKTSIVWTEFKELTLPNGEKKAQCLHCKNSSAFL